MGTLACMSTQLRAGASVEGAGAAPASRLASRRWRDPRLAVGVVLVAGSVVLGSRVLSAADDTTPVWSLNSDVTAGSSIAEGAVSVDDVQLADGGDTSLYLPGDEPFPVGIVATHDLVAGELLSHSDIGRPAERTGAELPVAVENGHRPSDLSVGDLVDVWVTPGDAETVARPARRELTAVTVVAVDVSGAGLGGAGSAAVVLLGLEEADAPALADTVAAVTSGTVVLVRVAG
jgi:hypothetical protein